MHLWFSRMTCTSEHFAGSHHAGWVNNRTAQQCQISARGGEERNNTLISAGPWVCHPATISTKLTLCETIESRCFKSCFHRNTLEKGVICRNFVRRASVGCAHSNFWCWGPLGFCKERNRKHNG
eukprot:764952-Amphidinium_carterae.1